MRDDRPRKLGILSKDTLASVLGETKSKPKLQHARHAQTSRMRRRKPGPSNRCLLYARNPRLICAVHPTGSDTDTCPDLWADPNAQPDELWEPEGASYYGCELILQPRQRWTPEKQLELLDTHSLFTGRCLQGEMTYPQYETPPVHWDCSACGWITDSVWGDGHW